MEQCFVIAPISTPPAVAETYGDAEHCRHVIDHLLMPAVERAGLEAVSPVARGSDMIHAEIVRELESASLVLCDLSTLNPNVLFELGIRTAVNKPVCLVRDLFTTSIPFDTGILNTHSYDGSLSVMVNDVEVSSLAAHISESLERSQGMNTLWRYFGLTSRGSFQVADDSTLDEKMDFLLAEVGALARPRPPVPGQERMDAVRHLMATLLLFSAPKSVSIMDFEEAVSQLPELERQVLTMRFGIDDEGGLRTLNEIASKVGRTSGEIRTVELVALDRLAQSLGFPSPMSSRRRKSSKNPQSS